MINKNVFIRNQTDLILLRELGETKRVTFGLTSTSQGGNFVKVGDGGGTCTNEGPMEFKADFQMASYWIRSKLHWLHKALFLTTCSALIKGLWRHLQFSLNVWLLIRTTFLCLFRGGTLRNPIEAYHLWLEPKSQDVECATPDIEFLAAISKGRYKHVRLWVISWTWHKLVSTKAQENEM